MSFFYRPPWNLLAPAFLFCCLISSGERSQAINFHTLALSDQAPAELGSVDGTYSLEAPAISESGDVIFRAFSQSTGQEGQDTVSLWKTSQAQNQLIVKTGDNAMIAGHYRTMQSLEFPTINDKGEMAFYGSSNSDISPDMTRIGGEGIWKVSQSGQLSNVVVQRSPSPQKDWLFTNIGGDVYYAYRIPNLPFGNTGDVAFYSDLRLPRVDFRSGEQWSTSGGMHNIYSQDSPPAIAGLDPSVVLHSLVENSSMGKDGKLYSITQFHGPGIDKSNNIGIFSEQNGNIKLLWQQGSVTVGIDHDFSILGPENALINQQGQTLAIAEIHSTPESILGLVSLDPQGTSHVVTAQGMAAPGTPWDDAIFGPSKSQSYPNDFYALSNAGTSAYFSLAHSPRTGEQAFGVWANEGGTNRLIVMGGTETPGIPDGIFYPGPLRNSASLSVPSAPHPSPIFTQNMSINNNGQVAILASFETPDNPYLDFGIWAEDYQKNLTLMVRTGDRIMVSPGDVREVSRLHLLGIEQNFGNITNENNSSFNSRGQLTFQATFTDGTSGIFLTNALTIPEPSSLAIATIVLVATSTFYRRRSQTDGSA